MDVIDDSTYTGFRNKVIIYVLLDTLVRISELCAMKRRNVNLEKGEIFLEAMDTKTRKARIVPINGQPYGYKAEFESSDGTYKLIKLTPLIYNQ